MSPETTLNIRINLSDVVQIVGNPFIEQVTDAHAPNLRVDSATAQFRLFEGADKGGAARPYGAELIE